MILDQRAEGEPETQPFNGILLQLHLQRHSRSPLDVARTAGVRYLTIWKMMHALPVEREDALRVRRGLLRLIGAWYAVPIQAHAEAAPSAQGQTGPKSFRKSRVV